MYRLLPGGPAIHETGTGQHPLAGFGFYGETVQTPGHDLAIADGVAPSVADGLAIDSSHALMAASGNSPGLMDALALQQASPNNLSITGAAAAGQMDAVSLGQIVLLHSSSVESAPFVDSLAIFAAHAMQIQDGVAAAWMDDLTVPAIGSLMIADAAGAPGIDGIAVAQIVQLSIPAAAAPASADALASGADHALQAANAVAAGLVDTLTADQQAAAQLAIHDAVSGAFLGGLTLGQTTQIQIAAAGSAGLIQTFNLSQLHSLAAADAAGQAWLDAIAVTTGDLIQLLPAAATAPATAETLALGIRHLLNLADCHGQPFIVSVAFPLTATGLKWDPIFLAALDRIFDLYGEDVVLQQKNGNQVAARIIQELSDAVVGEYAQFSERLMRFSFRLDKASPNVGDTVLWRNQTLPLDAVEQDDGYVRTLWVKQP